jgi:omega-amidase
VALFAVLSASKLAAICCGSWRRVTREEHRVCISTNLSCLHHLSIFAFYLPAAQAAQAKNTIRMGLCQVDVGDDKVVNIATATSAVKEAAAGGAVLVSLPECWNSPCVFHAEQPFFWFKLPMHTKLEEWR